MWQTWQGFFARVTYQGVDVMYIWQNFLPVVLPSSLVLTTVIVVKYFKAFSGLAKSLDNVAA